MQVTIAYGLEQTTYAVREDALVQASPALPAAVGDPVERIRTALEAPYQFPALRRALTPEDHITVVVDQRLPRLGELLAPVLEHIVGAGVRPEAVTILCPPGSGDEEWRGRLPESLRGVGFEVHDAEEQKRVAYLASTSKGKRCYLNRTLVEADQVVVLTACRYDPLTGYAGGETALFPALGDREARTRLTGRPHSEAPGAAAWPAREEATEVSWLLGVPFFVQVVEGVGDTVADVVAGAAESMQPARERLDAAWRRTVPRPAEVVVATLTGSPGRHTFADLAAALMAGSRVVRPRGALVLLTQAEPALAEAEALLLADEPREVLDALAGHPTLAQLPAWQWAHAASQARIYLLSHLDRDRVEELFAVPLEGPAQVQRLLEQAGSCLFPEDAHKTLAVVES